MFALESTEFVARKVSVCNQKILGGGQGHLTTKTQNCTKGTKGSGGEEESSVQGNHIIV